MGNTQEGFDSMTKHEADELFEKLMGQKFDDFVPDEEYEKYCEEAAKRRETVNEQLKSSLIPLSDNDKNAFLDGIVKEMSSSVFTAARKYLKNYSELSDREIVLYVIEEYVIYGTLDSVVDRSNALSYAGSNGYDKISDYITYLIRKQIDLVVPVCRNCLLRQRSNNYCPTMFAFVNDNLPACDCYLAMINDKERSTGIIDSEARKRLKDR